MTSEFDMSMMGELSFFLGFQKQQTPRRIFICQEKYTKELVKKFGMDQVKPMATPVHLTTKLDKNEDGKSINETKYRGMIGSLV